MSRKKVKVVSTRGRASLISCEFAEKQNQIEESCLESHLANWSCTTASEASSPDL